MDIRHCIDLAEALNETARAYLYHGTSFDGAYQILQSGKLIASDKRVEGFEDDEESEKPHGVAGYGYHHVSLTRDPRLRYYDADGDDKTATAPIVFVIDQERLQQSSRREPFAWNHSRSEAEEQAVTREIPLEQCCVGIRLYTPPKGFPISTDDLYRIGLDPDDIDQSEAKIKRALPGKLRDMYEAIAELAQDHGIPVQDLRRKSPKTVARAHVQANIDHMKGRPFNSTR